MPATHANGVIVQIEYAEQGGGQYRPGACNIGPAEIARRRRAGLFELGLVAVIAIVLVVVGAPPLARLVVFPVLAGAIVSLEQARRHFCAGFAMAGIRNFGAREDLEHVVDPAAKAADRRAALVMFGYSSLIAAAITALFVVLPI
jgi:hypothetical protein